LFNKRKFLPQLGTFTTGWSGLLWTTSLSILFDKLLNKYPMLVRHLGDAGAIVANAEFKRGIVKLQMGQEPSLTRGEKLQIRRFLRPIEAADEVEERIGSELLEALQEHRDRKMAHIAPPTTTNIVERLFSRAKIVLSDLRNRMTPRHLEDVLYLRVNLEDVLYLRVNRRFWNELTIQAIMDRPQPAPVAVEVEEMQEVN
jgi:hypothetical protein